MGFSRNKEDVSVREGQEYDDESDDEEKEEDEEQDAMNVDEEFSEEEPEDETFRREMRQKKETKKGLKKDNHLGICTKNKRCTEGVSRMIYKEAKDDSRLQDFMKIK
ncbi:hypothetical protein M9H77_17990 [Catharanthus roseus]|uniref:Uncharacterized protein n=1 Tax=Catharanthus roseus TaxID=4058 RepID=A0ACC0B6E1_CATRO|nr:hypothetical protein M9H77_17990 [Catharanthus roseus]